MHDHILIAYNLKKFNWYKVGSYFIWKQ